MNVEDTSQVVTFRGPQLDSENAWFDFGTSRWYFVRSKQAMFCYPGTTAVKKLSYIMIMYQTFSFLGLSLQTIDFRNEKVFSEWLGVLAFFSVWGTAALVWLFRVRFPEYFTLFMNSESFLGGGGGIARCIVKDVRTKRRNIHEVKRD